MSNDSALEGVSVLVAGAGLAGLTAARDLMSHGAAVIIIDARDRVGGRIWTIRDPFTRGQHAEAGGDLIDHGHHEVRTLAAELGLKLPRILRSGFGYARSDASGRVRLLPGGVARNWGRLAERLRELTRRYGLAEQRWDSPIVADIARHSVTEWLDAIQADAEMRAITTGVRSFFLADPDDLSLVALVDYFASWGESEPNYLYRVAGGNDRLTSALAATLGSRVRLNTELVAVSHRGREVRASVRHARAVAQITCDYLVFALPAPLLRRVPITPALPALQHDAIARLRSGHVTKTLLQFSRRFWRAAGRPAAFGSDLPFGAAWDGNEDQRGPAGILSVMAGGSASGATQAIVARGGVAGLANEFAWLGASTATLLASQQVVWEAEAWSRGGYVYFDPSYDPTLRAWLMRPNGRLFFAGEHTSIRYQGYLNGAVESGRRAAAEIVAVHRA